MQNEEFIEINKNGWNKLIKSKKPFSNTFLPEYGPFIKRNENDLKLMPNLKNKKILDLGCGSGKSLEYLYKKGASEIFGIDISEEQIKKVCKRFPKFKNNFYVSPMENEIDIPNNYFDYIISIFSIGYTSDLLKTLTNSYKYLNDNGSIIISWTHPFYHCLDVVNDKVIINKAYFKEDSEIIIKGTEKVNLVQKNLMISTFINTAKKAGFYVDTLLEEETILEDDINGYISSYFIQEKTIKCPTTLIIKLKKIIK